MFKNYLMIFDVKSNEILSINKWIITPPPPPKKERKKRPQGIDGQLSDWALHKIKFEQEIIYIYYLFKIFLLMCTVQCECSILD